MGRMARRCWPTASPTAFALMATMTGLGAIATQEKQLIAGKDPIDMTKPRFWLKALTQGGGLSIAGDLFLVDPAGSPGDATATLAKNLVGPSFGAIAGDLLAKNLVENIWQAAEGKDTHWEAELFSWAKAQTPGRKPLVAQAAHRARVHQRAERVDVTWLHGEAAAAGGQGVGAALLVAAETTRYRRARPSSGPSPVGEFNRTCRASSVAARIQDHVENIGVLGRRTPPGPCVRGGRQVPASRRQIVSGCSNDSMLWCRARPTFALVKSCRLVWRRLSSRLRQCSTCKKTP